MPAVELDRKMNMQPLVANFFFCKTLVVNL
jgi:hypothetical protein